MEEFYDAVVTIGVGRWAVVKVGVRFNVRYKADLTFYIKSHFCVLSRVEMLRTFWVLRQSFC